MESIRLHRRLLRWGNAFGLRVTRREAQQLGAGEKDPVSADLRVEAQALDPSRLHLVDLGPEASQRHREWAREASSVRH